MSWLFFPRLVSDFGIKTHLWQIGSFPLIDRGMTGGDPAPQGYERESQVELRTLVLKGLYVGMYDIAALPQSF